MERQNFLWAWLSRVTDAAGGRDDAVAVPQRVKGGVDGLDVVGGVRRDVGTEERNLGVDQHEVQALKSVRLLKTGTKLIMQQLKALPQCGD